VYFEIHGKGKPLVIFSDTGNIIIEAGEEPYKKAPEFLKKEHK
jgi:hypothetical protein